MDVLMIRRLQCFGCYIEKLKNKRVFSVTQNLFYLNVIFNKIGIEYAHSALHLHCVVVMLNRVRRRIQRDREMAIVRTLGIRCIFNN